jgi:hypothetical protein
MATISIQFKDEKSKAGDVVDIRIVSKTKLDASKLDKFTRAQRMAIRVMTAMRPPATLCNTGVSEEVK